MIFGLLFAPRAFAQTIVSGDISSDTTWSSDIVLDGPVFVLSGATLTIGSGVTVYGEKESIGTLIIAQGAKLNINGTEDAPVVFTSDQASPARGDWGGLILNGYAPLNVEGGVASGEGDTGEFGGSDAADNSGSMSYFRVEYAGIEFSPENELNGIALQGVGSGTTLDHFQVHANLDDGIEMFGGSVNFKYGIITQCADDSIDWTYGWNGSAQFVVVQQSADDADNGIEADNLNADNDATPRSAPTIFNVTLIGDPATTAGDESDLGMLMRRGTGCNIRNGIVMGFKEVGLDIDDEATFTQAQTGGLVIDNCIFSGNLEGIGSDDTDEEGYTIPFTSATFLTTNMQNNLESDPMLGAPYDLTDPDFRPSSGSPAIDGTVAVASVPAGNSFIVATDYIGAVDPDDDWTRKPWTRFGLASWTQPTPTPTAAPTPTPAPTAAPTPTPAPTPNPCVATSILGADNPKLDVLRSFRDSKMSQSVTGNLQRTLYYMFTGEITRIVSEDPELSVECAALLEEVIALVEASLNGEEVEVSDALQDDIIAVLDKISAKAGLGLKLAIFKIKMDIMYGNISL